MEKQVNIKSISLFSKPANTVKPVDKVSLVDLYKLITSDKYKEPTEELRGFLNPNVKREYKGKSFDFFTGSGIFPYRADDALKYHSGYIVIDLDHIEGDLKETMTKLITDDYLYVLLMFVSPSGDGLKVFYGIDLSQGGHRKWFKAIRNYLHETYGLEADPSGINQSRTCFLPYDPECYACKEIKEYV
jgi:hypothetical protein